MDGVKEEQRTINLHNGDCLEVLRSLPGNSIDAVVTDPPAGIGFMSADWDHDKGGRDQWVAWLTSIMVEALRVLKPGAHMLVWALPRQSHWTATAIELAGFEIRDIVHHLFSTGMPHSYDVSKGIDKQLGAQRDVIAQKKRSLGHDPKKVYALGRVSENYTVTAPSSAAAKQWDGWGTALKPAAEHWILARKPLAESTVTQNVLRHGTGAIHIDQARYGDEQRFNPSAHNKPGGNSLNMSVQGMPQDAPGRATVGRWPSNVLLTVSDDSGSPDVAIDRMGGGYSKSKRSQRGTVKIFDKERYGVADSGWRGESTERGFDDEGGASRFFARFIYCAKASPKERGQANNHPTVKGNTLMQYLVLLITPPGGTVLDMFMGSGSTGIACIEQGFDFIGIEKEPDFFQIAIDRLQTSYEN